MIDLNVLIALVSFYFVMYVTPGPNNAMVLASGIKIWFFKNNSPHVWNNHWSYYTINFSLFWLGKIFQIFPEIQNILKIFVQFIYYILDIKLLDLLIKLKRMVQDHLKFYEAALFQIVNPKAWTISSMAASGFLPKDGNLIISIFFIAFVALNYLSNINISLGCFWFCYKKFCKE